jgi:hypothetical protein
MADDNAALMEAIDKLTEAVDGVEDAAKAHPDAQIKTKVTEYLACSRIAKSPPATRAKY